MILRKWNEQKTTGKLEFMRKKTIYSAYVNRRNSVCKRITIANWVRATTKWEACLFMRYLSRLFQSQCNLKPLKLLKLYKWHFISWFMQTVCNLLKLWKQLGMSLFYNGTTTLGLCSKCTEMNCSAKIS